MNQSYDSNSGDPDKFRFVGMTSVYLLGVLSIKSVLLDALIHKEMPFVLVDKRHFFVFR